VGGGGWGGRGVGWGGGGGGWGGGGVGGGGGGWGVCGLVFGGGGGRGDLHSFPTRRSSDLSVLETRRRHRQGVSVGDRMRGLHAPGLEHQGFPHGDHLEGGGAEAREVLVGCGLARDLDEAVIDLAQVHQIRQEPEVAGASALARVPSGRQRGGNFTYSSINASASDVGGGRSLRRRPRARRSSTRRFRMRSRTRSSPCPRHARRSRSSAKQYAFHEIEKRTS